MQDNRDNDHLRLLSLFHYIHAAIVGCSTTIGTIWIGFMAAMFPAIIEADMAAQAERQKAAAKQASEAAGAEDTSEDAVTTKAPETTEDENSKSSRESTSPPTKATPPAPIPPVNPQPPEAMLRMMTGMMWGMGTVMLIFGFAMAFANVYAGQCIARRKHRTFCLVTAGFNCLNTPFGLILGIFSFLLYFRPSIEDQFEGRVSSEQPVVDAAIID